MLSISNYSPYGLAVYVWFEHLHLQFQTILNIFLLLPTGNGLDSRYKDQLILLDDSIHQYKQHSRRFEEEDKRW